MSDPRKPTIKLKRDLPVKTGRFRPDLIIELYPAWQWSDKFGPQAPKRKSCGFFGKSSPSDGKFLTELRVFICQGSRVNDFYRLKINGRWYRENGFEYEFFEKSKAYKLLEHYECIPSPK